MCSDVRRVILKTKVLNAKAPKDQLDASLVPLIFQLLSGGVSKVSLGTLTNLESPQVILRLPPVPWSSSDFSRTLYPIRVPKDTQ